MNGGGETYKTYDCAHALHANAWRAVIGSAVEPMKVGRKLRTIDPPNFVIPFVSTMLLGERRTVSVPLGVGPRILLSATASFRRNPTEKVVQRGRKILR